MSCDAAALALSLHLAALHPAGAEPPAPYVPAVAAAPALNPLAREPLFASIVAKARRLQGEVDASRKGAGPAGAGWKPPADFGAEVAALSEVDMQGHLELAKRGTDGDLKCILRGISQDLPRKLDDLQRAQTVTARKGALDDLFYLLRDNIEVITSPPQQTSTDVAGKRA